MRPFALRSPSALSDALSLLSDAPAGSAGAPASVRPLAGGTDLLPLMKSDIVQPELLVDLKRLVDLDDRITIEGDRLRIGALATLAEIEQHPLVLEHAAALSQSAGLAATPQLRNMATIGGNLLQRPRCWYFRNSLINCWLKGGNDCPAAEGENQLHALFGGGPCVAVHPSDSPAALIALDASVRIVGPNGKRTIPVEQFFALPTDEHRLENVLQPDDIIQGIDMPLGGSHRRSVYLKAMDRKVWAFALVGVAAVVAIDGGRITTARLVLSGVAPIPWRVIGAEDLLRGAAPSPELFGQVATAALADAQPLSHNGYKVPLAHALITRALTEVSG